MRHSPNHEASSLHYTRAHPVPLAPACSSSGPAHTDSAIAHRVLYVQHTPGPIHTAHTYRRPSFQLQHCTTLLGPVPCMGTHICTHKCTNIDIGTHIGPCMACTILHTPHYQDTPQPHRLQLSCAAPPVARFRKVSRRQPQQHAAHTTCGRGALRAGP